MEIDSRMQRELSKRFELELNKREMEVTENWRQEIETVYRKKYESLAAFQVEIRNLVERMNNRVKMLTRIVREG
jgi:transposase